MPTPTDPKTVTLVSPEGVATDVPVAQQQQYADRGFTAQTQGERTQSNVDTTVAAHTSKAKAFAYGLARGATFGGSDLLLDDDQKIDAQDAEQVHGASSFAGNIAGALLTGGAIAGRLGEHAAESFSTRGALTAAEGAAPTLLGRTVGGVAEGSVYGAGQGLSEVALSDDPLSAERIASTLSSNILLGGVTGGVAGGVFHGVERGLSRASDSLAAASSVRNALEGIPGDLSTLDEAGLKEASVAAKSEHAADIASERQSLEQLRVEQRAELSNQVRDLHTELATEKPIYAAVTGDDLAKIEGVKDIKVQLAKSFSGMRSQLDNEIAVARDPRSLIRPLEMRQGALEKLQEKLPELHAALVGDARGDALAHVGDALEQTKQQIAAIEQLSPKTPVGSGRLTMLEANPSARMQAIDAARDALKKAPEIGLAQKGIQAGAFAGGTALAHMIPGVGIAAPFLGKGASDMVGKLFEHLAGASKAITARSAAATEQFLSVARRAAEYAPSTATKVLGAVRYAANAPEPKSSALPDLFKARTSELKTQTMYAPDGSVQMRPEARAALAAKLDPIRMVNPKLADQIETQKALAVAYTSSKIPRRPDVGGIQIGPDNWQPSDLAMRSWARTVRAVEDPCGVEERLAAGTITPEDAEAYRHCYPERFTAMQMKITTALPQLSKTLPLAKKVSLSVFYGVPITPLMMPNVLDVLQGNFADEAGSNGGTNAPAAAPKFGSMGSLKSADKPTAAQQREG